MKKHRGLTAILVLAAVLRAGLLLAAFYLPRGEMLTPDSEGYINLAQSLASQGEFKEFDRPEIFRTPGYPVFLMLGGLLGAYFTVSLGMAILVQVLLDVVVVFLTYRLGIFLVSRRVGLFAACFQAITPLVVASSCRVLADSLYVFFFTAAVLLMVKHLRSGGWWTLLGSSAVLGAACYVRPVGQVMGVIFALSLLSAPKRWRRVAAFAAVFAACLAPWVIRNAVVADYYGFSSYAGDAMYFFAVPELRAREGNLNAQDLRDELRREESDKLSSAGQPLPSVGQTARRRMREAVRFIFENPGAYARIHLKGAVGFWVPGATDVLEEVGLSRGNRGTVDVLHRDGLLAAVKHYFGENILGMMVAAPLVLVFLVKYVGVVLCVFGRVRFRFPPEVWLLVGVAVVSAILPGPFGLPRYRLPVAPLLSIAAAVGWLIVVKALRRKGTKGGTVNE